MKYKLTYKPVLRFNGPRKIEIEHDIFHPSSTVEGIKAGIKGQIREGYWIEVDFEVDGLEETAQKIYDRLAQAREKHENEEMARLEHRLALIKNGRKEGAKLRGDL